MNTNHWLKSNAAFFTFLMLLFVCILFSLYSRHSSFPDPLPNEYPQDFTTPGKAP
jgi:hypothetical protein